MLQYFFNQVFKCLIQSPWRGAQCFALSNMVIQAFYRISPEIKGGGGWWGGDKYLSCHMMACISACHVGDLYSILSNCVMFFYLPIKKNLVLG